MLGTPADKDEVVYPKSGDETKLPDASYSEDGHWLIVELVTGANREDIYFRDLRTAASAHAPFVPLVTGRDAEFRVDAYRDHFYIQTNDGAAHGKLVVADPAHPQPDRWKTLIAERDDEILTDTGIVGGKLSITYRKDVASRLELHRLDGTLDTEIPLPGLGTTAALSGRQDATVGYYWYASYTFPQEIFRYDLKLKKATSYYRQKLPLTPEDYVAEEGFAPLEGRDQGAGVRRPPEGCTEVQRAPRAHHPLRLRRLRRGADAGVLGLDHPLARQRGSLRLRQLARWLGVRRGLAPPGEAPRQAARLRRRHRQRRVVDP